ncbi:LRR receptor-like serine/threonine-protein kinase RGI1 [Mangifera indica]|uniref:LRR receptor-like serine/threonine-protein kinase RGI1 n=1 Tax=Mangifera indica TaxID=29780 RepID=UPI001CFB91F6|nr:LRR receptor-like serine/threonine-protein kinase RGI1 [Mangifera indica]
MSMPSSRHSFFFYNLSSFPLFFFFTLILSTLFTTFTGASQNHEVSILFSWLHSSPSLPLSSFSNWNILDANPCNWTSITCSPQGLVTEISIQSVPLQLPIPTNLSSFRSLSKLVISDANLTGTIPVDIGDCVGLKVLDFSSNSLVGSIPSSLGKLQDLEDLTLNSNQLTGKIPVELCDCRSLKNLLLFDNLLGGNIPPELGKLSNLEVLRAGGNKDFVGKIPGELGDCRNLTVLGLADTRVSGSLPASLGKLSKLQTLSIYTSMISGEIPPSIGNCSELVNLFLYENSLSGSIPPELGKLQKLDQLLLWKNNLAGFIPEELGNCSSLKMIDISLNFLSGTIPLSLGGLLKLEEFMISDNNVSGSIPSNISNATNLSQLQLDTNQISGLIPPELGMLSKLTVFFAWQNQLEGSIPSSLSGCTNLQALDLSHNSLTGSIPAGLFQLQNLTKLLLIANDISGSIPTEIGNCISLLRLRLGNNRIAGGIPQEIGGLKSLNFLDLSSNHLSGSVPDEIGDCTELQMIDLSNNTLQGPLPNSLSSLSGLQVLDVSVNRFGGQIPASLGRLVSLNKLILSKNSFSGVIPTSLGLCSSLQLLDLSANGLTGSIPMELGQLEALEIALNLSCNELTGPIPAQISALTKLSILDLSHNKLEGNLVPLAELDNLVSLNFSYNNFTGYLPDNKLFRQLSPTDLAGNEGLCSSSQNSCFLSDVGRAGLARNENDVRRSQKLKVAIALLITLTMVMAITWTTALIRAHRTIRDDDDSELGDSWPWQFTPFQKLNFSVEQVLGCLTDANVIGKGCSGVVYRAEMENGEVIAVKKLWPTTMAATNGCNDEKCGVRDSFSAEIKTLGSIRHKNIVRFLGCCWNRNTRLLMYDYMPNGSLGSLLHERSGNSLEWELRYQILLGAAQGLAYLHHDCAPPIVHRDIKANNILIGLEFEPYIADFGLAKLVDDGDFARSSNTLAGSYGYIAPEYGYMMKITEKSDVYSYGVVVLEVLTGKQPIDPTIPDGSHVVDWVRQKRGGIEVLDPSLLSRPESEIDEMMQALGIALLCVNSSPDQRPTMKDVAAMLKEIKHEREEYAKVDVLVKGSPATDFQEKKISSGIPAPSSSKQQSLHLKNINTSFSASSLLYSSSSSTKMSFK